MIQLEFSNARQCNPILSRLKLFYTKIHKMINNLFKMILFYKVNLKSLRKVIVSLIMSKNHKQIMIIFPISVFKNHRTVIC